VKILTQIINQTKQEMDKVKDRLDQKAEEKKMQMKKGDFN
jgi:hypothetical protein